ncbi:MAG TPA: hypothetical protein VE641_19790 [Chthoniobacterales bacterium]|jgi:short-subunit dehydrogenase involved in D-alanine esterification of teichoic acids|nr:hypothetical protein [Chthoniobacterales bacterium]
MLQQTFPSVKTNTATANGREEKQKPQIYAANQRILKTQPTPSEICVDHGKFLRFAETNGNFSKALEMLGSVIL